MSLHGLEYQKKLPKILLVFSAVVMVLLVVGVVLVIAKRGVSTTNVVSVTEVSVERIVEEIESSEGPDVFSDLSDPLTRTPEGRIEIGVIPELSDLRDCLSWYSKYEVTGHVYEQTNNRISGYVDSVDLEGVRVHFLDGDWVDLSEVSSLYLHQRYVVADELSWDRIVLPYSIEDVIDFIPVGALLIFFEKFPESDNLNFTCTAVEVLE